VRSVLAGNVAMRHGISSMWRIRVEECTQDVEGSEGPRQRHQSIRELRPDVIGSSPVWPRSRTAVPFTSRSSSRS